MGFINIYDNYFKKIFECEINKHLIKFLNKIQL